jgi:betaine-aldehyde dehydrogenase
MVAVASAAKTEPLLPNLPSHRDPYYAGRWQKPKSPRYVDSISPGTGEPLGPVVDGSAADAEAAIAAAKAAFAEWRRVPPLERAKMLRAIADVLRKNGEELAMIDAADCGNPYAEMVRDAQMGAAQLDFYAGLVTEMKGASIPMGPDAVNFSVREPFGVVGRIIPFNHPFMFVAGKSAAPLAAGNTIVVKPPEQAPLSSLRLAELIDGILPPGVWNLVPGGKEVGQVLASHPDVAKVAQGPIRSRAPLYRRRQAGWRAAHRRRQTAERPQSRQGLLRRGHRIRRRDHGHAHRQGGDLRPGSVHLQMARRE